MPIFKHKSKINSLVILVIITLQLLAGFPAAQAQTTTQDTPLVWQEVKLKQIGVQGRYGQKNTCLALP